MQREIKFRARLIKEDGTPWLFYQGDQYLISFLRRCTSFIKNKTDGEAVHESYLAESLENCLDRFTSLKDKNGKEIYEGDIVTTPKCDSPRVVRYAAPEFHLYKGMGDDIDTLVDCDSFTTPMAFEEVIGNIYENPELLSNPT